MAPVLDAPSEASVKSVEKKTGKVMEVSKVEENRLNFYKKKEGLVAEESKDTKPKKRKVKGGPNPLSCKKKKVKRPEDGEKTKSGKVEKGRKRIKVPKHVKELLLSQNS